MKVALLFPALCALLATPAVASGRHASVSSESGRPAVLWYAPFLSGGGYCSEAHSYVVAVDAALGESTVSSSDSGSQEDSEASQDDESEEAMEPL